MFCNVGMKRSQVVLACFINEKMYTRGNYVWFWWQNGGNYVGVKIYGGKMVVKNYHKMVAKWLL